MSKFFASLTVALMLTQWASARLPVNWAPLLQTSTGQKMLGHLLPGTSFEQIGNMGLTARKNALLEVLNKNNELSTKWSQVAGEVSRASNPEQTAQKLVAQLRGTQGGEPPSTLKAKGLVGRMRSQAQGMTARLQNAFEARTDIAKSTIRTIVQAGKNAKANGMELYGPDAARCAKNFDGPLVGSLAKIVAGVAGSRQIASAKQLFNSLVKGAENTSFKEVMPARQRVCSLAGRGANCSIFARGVAANCI